jgi:hypothetical protein
MYEWKDGVEIKKEFRLTLTFRRRKYRVDVYSLEGYSAQRLVGLDCMVNKFVWDETHLEVAIDELKRWHRGGYFYAQARRNRVKRRNYLLRKFRRAEAALTRKSKTT